MRFLGAVADPRAALARAHCLLHCADREPFGLALVEALAAGRPVAAPGRRRAARDRHARVRAALPPGRRRRRRGRRPAVLADAARRRAAARARAAAFDGAAAARRFARRSTSPAGESRGAASAPLACRAMRRAVPAVAAACLLAGPTVLAFFSGGYYAEPRLIAAIVAWLLVLALALAGPAPLPRSRAGRAARSAGSSLLDALERAVAHLGAAAAVRRSRASQRLAALPGALLLGVGVAADAALRCAPSSRRSPPAPPIVIGYGLAGRLLPGIVELDRSRSAGGRLEQPITYWNAEGALAAIGLVLCARAGRRPHAGRAALRAAAAAAAVAARRRRLPLVLARRDRGRRARPRRCSSPRRPRARSCAPPAIALAAGAAAAAIAAAFPASPRSRARLAAQRDGAIVLALLVADRRRRAAVATTRAGAARDDRDGVPRAPPARPAAARRSPRPSPSASSSAALGERPSDARARRRRRAPAG